MEKAVKTLFLTLLVLAATGVANAGWTNVVYNQAATSEVALNKSFQWGTNGVGWDYTTSWDHEWVIPSDPELVSIALTAASLSIESQYTNSPKIESIRLDNLGNPSLGDLNSGWTSFDVLSYASVLDGDTTVFATLFDGGDWGTVVLKNSKLDLTYEVTVRVWEDDPIPEPPAVPAPAAVILGSLGAGLVGWLRKRSLV